MKEYKRRRSLSGAVLIMILTVMFVLIILLTATLTTVTTANQRIYTKFEENQAYYTARSALDVFTMNMLDDENYIAQDSGSNRKYKYGDSSSTTPADLTQGLALQLDLYTIKAQSGHNINQADLDSSASGITDADKKKDEYKTYYGTDSSKVQNNGKPVTDPEYAEYVEYEVELPSLENGSNKYGKLSDKESNIPKAKIKVEILERQYDMGVYNFATAHNGITDVKTYIDSLSDDDLKTFFDGLTSGSQDAKDIASAIIAGNRKKDRMRVKITATTTFDGVEGTAVLIYDTHEPPVNNSNNAVTTFGGGGSDNMNIIGGASMTGNVDWNNDGVVYGSCYYEDEFKISNNGPRFRLTDGEQLLIGGDLISNVNNFKVWGVNLSGDQKKRPTVYVEGEFEFKALADDALKDVDIVTHGMKCKGNNLKINNCNIYCKGTFDMSKVDEVTSSGGNIYVDGDIILKSSNDSNTFRVYKGDAGDQSTWQVKLGGTGATIYQTGGTIKDDVGNNVKAMGIPIDTTPTSMPSLTLPNFSDIADPISGNKTITITLPLSAGTITKDLKTHVDSFDSYYQKDASGKLIDSTGAVITNPATQNPVPISAEVQANKSGFSESDLGITTYLPSNATIDTTDSSTLSGYIIKSGANIGTVRIKGGGTVDLVFENTGNVWGDQYSGNIIVDSTSKTEVKFYGKAGNYKLFNFNVYNTETEAAMSGTDLNVGNVSGCNIVVPKIYYYFSSGSKVQIYNGGFLTGYFYAPDAELSANVGGKNIKVKYNGGSVVSHNPPSTNVNITVVGSVVAQKINMPNGNGIAYINPDLDDDTPGKPIHDFETFQYVRS